uniref:CAZy families GT10 protein n=1 Tax=uncultured Parabacteroides sp. TaxID=512312 RepID=A0A060C965_9BACT|nr:CAZy families GT10 protein [uncultured Parabacteroides sp.]
MYSCLTLFPLYYGCTNICDYFPKGALEQIDIHDVEGAIRLIDDVINQDLAVKNAAMIQESKMKVLDEYNMFPFVVSYLNKMNPNAKKEIVTMKDDLSFFDIQKPLIVVGRKASQLKYKLLGK